MSQSGRLPPMAFPESGIPMEVCFRDQRQAVADPNLPHAGVGFRAFQLAHDLIDPRAAPAAWAVIPVALG
jgi:hypothetical protein